MGLVLGEKESGSEGEAKRKERDRKKARQKKERDEREKSVARENSAHIILPRYNEETYISGTASLLPRVISTRIRKSFPALTADRIAPRSEVE